MVSPTSIGIAGHTGFVADARFAGGRVLLRDIHRIALDNLTRILITLDRHED